MDKFKEMFNDYVRAFLVVIWSLFTFIFIFCITFITIPKDNLTNVGTVIGFIFGVVSGGMGVYTTINPSGKKSNINVEENTGDIKTESK